MSTLKRRHFLYNLSGTLVPLGVALAAFPLIARLAGPERLGFLGLAWTLIGYLGLLDLGLSRVLMRRVAVAHTPAELARERAVVLRLCRLLLIMVLPLALLLARHGPVRWLLGSDAAAPLAAEAQQAWVVMMATVPWVVVAGVLGGVLDGRQWFGISNLLKIGLGSWNFLAPAIVAWAGHATLPAMILAVASGRVLATLANALVVHRALPRLAGGTQSLPAPVLAPIIAEGGWMTVSNIVGPVMTRLDRFQVAAALSLGAAAFYLVPQELVLRALLIPAALANTLFPTLARVHAGADTAGAQLSARALRAVCALSLPLSLALGVGSSWGLGLWMGTGFAAQGGAVLAILAPGLYANCAAQVPFTVLQAAGRAGWIARIHLVELPLYVSGLWVALHFWGLEGAALTWSLRTTVDCGLMLLLARRLGPVGQIRVIFIGLTLSAAVAATVLWLDEPLRALADGLLCVLGLTIALRWAAAVRAR